MNKFIKRCKKHKVMLIQRDSRSHDVICPLCMKETAKLIKMGKDKNV